MNKKLIFSVLLICLLAFAAVLAFGQSGPSVRWEYRVARTGELNELGAEGWELVSVTAVGNPAANNVVEKAYLKRRLP